MQKLLPSCVVSAVCLSFVLQAGAAHAESYQLFNLGADDVSLLGIDAAGTALLQQFNGCNGMNSVTGCYEEFSAGNLVYQSVVAPTNFVAQNGGMCNPPTGLSVTGRSVCDGSYQVAGGNFGDVQGVWESYPGSATPGDFVYSGTADVLDLNAVGDFLVDDGLYDSVYQVMVAQTPEPSSLLLLFTGAVASGGMIRRRLLTA